MCISIYIYIYTHVYIHTHTCIYIYIYIYIYSFPTAVLRASVLHACGFDSIGILLYRGEIIQNTGNPVGNSTRRMLINLLTNR